MMNTGTHTNGIANTTSEEERQRAPRYEKRSHNLASLERLAKEKEAEARKVRKRLKDTRTVLDRIHAAETNANEARVELERLSENIRALHGTRFVYVK